MLTPCQAAQAPKVSVEMAVVPDFSPCQFINTAVQRKHLGGDGGGVVVPGQGAKRIDFFDKLLQEESHVWSARPEP